ncbi:tetratricopeptide (TPR) repeat protein/DNA-binding CsgD family transcriptional regulator [Flavobacterium arsenatis]|uniref:Tetratricopeptide (TPR) repeat protein/DNA-binding CsgD family transcriptional regulator n=1 Tax=Flavobacterium arsenatis TaxID=1484332 RepID=A0ABU1TUK4_9FLAO|nr:tetratricopeptide (TPR) repeat protein/DNA-binding CsgD family transcriptional regulator [Flavobacterium arsenatis]
MLIVLLVLQANFSFAQASKAKCDSLIEAGKKALDKNQHTHSLELLFQALDLAKNNGLDKQEFLALNNIGTNYYRLSEFGEALNYYLEGYTIAIKKLTPNEEILVLNNIAILYFEEKKYDQAKDYFTRVYTASKENKENLTAGVAAINLGTLSVEKNDLELAKNYYEEALPLVSERPEYIVLAKGGLANCELLLGNTNKARKTAQYLIDTTKDLEFYHADVELLLIIAKSYLQENKLDVAEEYIQKITTKKPKLETKIKLYKLLTEINIKRKTLDRALQYKDSLFEATAKLNASKNEKLFENSKIKFELQQYKNQSMLNEAKLVSERKIFYFVLLFIIVIVLFALWTVRNLSLKLKQKKLIAERNEQILALELEKEKRESLLLEKQFNENQAVSLLQQEKLKNEVEIKNRKLSAKALYLSGKNEMIEEILSELSVLPQVSKDNTLVSHIHSLKNQLKADNEWDNFITHFEEVNQGFLDALKSKHPALTINDIRYISYIYMSLSTKEIASMLSITQDSCRKRKERVLAKMNLPKETNLYDYLTSL